MAHETSASIAAWGGETFGPVADFTVLVQRARGEFDELERAVGAGDAEEIGAEAADVVILLHRLCGLLGVELSEQVDSKMQINRARRWIASGDGVGRHTD
ncbi:MAG: nucleotide pyrophosphohydrolase [Hyphomonadaceae bacterium]